MKSRLALFILLAMVLGVVAGWATTEYLDKATAAGFITGYGLLTKIFITMIKMIIAPLVLFTLIAGIGHMEDAAAVGRIGAKSLGWFILMSIISLVLGMIMVEWLQPGVGMNLQVAGEPAAVPNTANFTLVKFIEHLIPSSIVKAMADNEILQIVIFAVFVGTAVAMLDDKAPQVMVLVEQAANIMLKVTEIVMLFAPFAIFGALAKVVAEQGLPILITYAKFMGGFYASMGILWVILIALAFLFIGARTIKLLGVIREPTLLAFSTASSEAAYPKLLAGLPTIGISRKITSFVLPLGYSFNLDGSMLYCTFATLFIAQAHGIEFTMTQKIMMLFLLLITSKGIAGVPRASLVVIMATLTYFGLPAEWIAVVLGVDALLDMGRSATNVVGNSVAAAVVAKWENALDKDENSGEAGLTMRRSLITRDAYRRELLLGDVGRSALIGAVWCLPTVFAIVCAVGLCFIDLASDVAKLHFSMFSAALPLVVRFAVDRSLPGFMALAYVAQFAILIWLGDELCQALISLRQYLRFG